jgi:hypothetical protein
MSPMKTSAGHCLLVALLVVFGAILASVCG